MKLFVKLKICDNKTILGEKERRKRKKPPPPLYRCAIKFAHKDARYHRHCFVPVFAGAVSFIVLRPN